MSPERTPARCVVLPGSTLKILTALTVLPQLDPEASYVAQWEDAIQWRDPTGLGR